MGNGLRVLELSFWAAENAAAKSPELVGIPALGLLFEAQSFPLWETNGAQNVPVTATRASLPWTTWLTTFTDPWDPEKTDAATPLHRVCSLTGKKEHAAGLSVSTSWMNALAAALGPFDELPPVATTTTTMITTMTATTPPRIWSCFLLRPFGAPDWGAA
jgi:hypothetical protein